MFTRREFLKKCMELAVAIGCSPIIGKDLARAFERIAKGDVKVIFLQGQCCTGCSVSLLYGDSPEMVYVITKIIDTQFHPNISAAQGELVMEIIKENMKNGNYFVVMEGAIPKGMKEACYFGEDYFYTIALECVKNSLGVIAMGTCASWGGIPASNMNVTGAISVEALMKENGINKPFIRVPGCPVHPDRLLGSVAYLVAYGKPPELDGRSRPKVYFGKDKKIHDNCPRFQYFTQDKFAMSFNEKERCLLKKGCRGPITYADCPQRRWNQGTNFCISANAPCIGCVNEDFPYKPDNPFYTDPREIK